MIQWESLNELHAFRLLDCDPQVTAFHEQPCEIVFVQNGEVRRHYPDVCVETRDSKELWEIKPESEASRAEIVARTTLLSNALRQYGFTYRLVLAHDLARQPRQHNANILLRHGRRAPTEGNFGLVLSGCSGLGVRRSFSSYSGFVLSGDFSLHLHRRDQPLIRL